MLGLIGAGYWGKHLARNFDALGALHTICDMDEELLKAYRERYPKAKLCSDYHLMLHDPAITAVAIATPAKEHFVMAKESLLAGKDVYVEKPLCLSLEEGEELIELAQAKNRILMVGHILRYHPCVRKLQELIASGALGKLQYISSNRLNLGKICTHENALWSYAPHDMSVILALTGSLPLQVSCSGGTYLSPDVADLTLTTLHFPDNLRGHVYVSWLNPFKEQKLTVIGAKGMAVFDDTKPWEEKLVLYHDYLDWTQGAPVPNPEGTAEAVVVPEAEPLREECAHFLASCAKRAAPLTDGREGLQVLQVLEAAQASLLDNGGKKSPLERHNISFVSPRYEAHPTATIDPDATIGDGCKIGRHVDVIAGVTCEEEVFIGPSCVFTNLKAPRKGEQQPTLLRRGCTVGANATIRCGVEIGAYAFITAGAVVADDVKSHALIEGNPGTQVGWVSRAGQPLDLPLTVVDCLEALCPTTGERYQLKGDRLRLLSSQPELASV